MARFTVSMRGTYDIPDGSLMQIYGTNDPVKCAEMDALLPVDDLLNCCHEVFVDVTSAPDAEMTIHHKCDDPRCTDITHLEIVPHEQ